MIPDIAASKAADLAFKYVLSYTKTLWPKYLIGKHHVLISKYLEAVEAGQITRLMIFMPPRSGKTKLVAENFIPWYIGRNPDHQIIYSTYSFDRAGDVGRTVRNNVASETHRAIFPGCNISPDNKGSNKFATLEGGIANFVGTGGGVTGRGAHLFLIDDPIKGPEDADSETARNKLQRWFTSVAYTRLMNTNAIVLIMTRWSYYDLAGWLLEETAHENWTVLSLPALAEEDDDVIGRSLGDALWPEMYPRQRLEMTKATMSTREWNALYQQRPLPEEGGMVQLGWFQRYSLNDAEFIAWKVAIRMGVKSLKPPYGIKRIVCSWDTAFKESQLNDPSACTVWGVADNGFYLLDVINRHMGYPDLRKCVVDTHEKWSLPKLGPATVLIEDKASGQSLIQDLRRSTRIPVVAINPEASKQVRLSEVTNLIEGGRVYLPEKAPWLVDYETQISQFPYGKNDDMVDSTSQFLRWGGKPRYHRSKKLRFWK